MSTSNTASSAVLSSVEAESTNGGTVASPAGQVNSLSSDVDSTEPDQETSKAQESAPAMPSPLPLRKNITDEQASLITIPSLAVDFVQLNKKILIKFNVFFLFQLSQSYDYLTF